MTNLLAAAAMTAALASSPDAITEITDSVAIVTNVVEVDNAQWACESCLPSQPDVILLHDCQGSIQTGPATRKTKIITIRKVFAISFMWRGGKWTIRDGVTISEKVEKWKKKEEWEKVE